jgi:hypothetical protein
MAKTTSRPPKRPTPIDSNTAVLDTPFDIDPPKPTPPPTQLPEAEKKPEPPRLPSFYQTMNKIQKVDWGARATIYLYRVEPIIDRTRSGECKYIMTYAEPISEDRIMADCGSGRYKLILNFRKPGAEQGDTMDTTYMDLLNMKFPPKIPIGEWVDDPRNKKWAWAKEATAPPPAPPPATGVETFVDVLRAAGEIRKEIREEMAPPSVNGEKSEQVDPWSAAEKILQMRSDNPMVTILMGQMDAMQKAAEAQREREFKAAEAARQREYDLQKELRQQSTPAPAKGLVEQIVELAGVAEKLGPLKALFGNGTASAAEGTTRAAKMGTLEFLSDVIPKMFESPLAHAVAQKIVTSTENQNPAPTMQQGAPPPRVNGNAPSSDPFERFIGDVVTPVMLDYFKAEMGGDDFADWLYSGFPANFKRLQQFTHPGIPGLVGAPAIVTAYKNTPRIWPLLAAHEARFIEFVNAFCNWKPDTEEDFQDVEGKTIDLDAEPGEARPS